MLKQLNYLILGFEGQEEYQSKKRLKEANQTQRIGSKGTNNFLAV